MKADKQRLPVIKSILSDIIYAEKANTKTSIVSLIQKGIKKRQDSIVQYTSGGRPELAQQEEFEINVMNEYLPKMASKEETKQIVEALMNEIEAKSIKQIGLIMKAIDQKGLSGSVDKKLVSVCMREILGA